VPKTIKELLEKLESLKGRRECCQWSYEELGETISNLDKQIAEIEEELDGKEG